MNLVTEYPIWLSIASISIGLIYAMILYFRERKEEFSGLSKVLMGILRFLAVSLLAFFLLGPMIQSNSQLVENPLVVMAHDNSQSVITGPDSSFYRYDYVDILNEFSATLKNDFDVRQYTFGEDVKQGFNLNFSEQSTDISDLFKELDNRYSNTNLGAVILFSDGTYNRGHNPLYASDGLNVPVYTVALGDTNIYRDIQVYKVNYNRVAYAGNEFPVEIVIRAKKSDGQSAVVTVSDGAVRKFSKRITSKGSDHFVRILVLSMAKNEAFSR
ncbi:MAG: hypothetical protein K8R53_07470, partial [Bacteroidales bacterium]|nr:hypothetical protein [Bacteroidales bacterium]